MKAYAKTILVMLIAIGVMGGQAGICIGGVFRGENGGLQKVSLREQKGVVLR